VAQVRAVPAQRLASIDLLRILAVVGIIWFHTEGAPHREIGYAALPVFLLLFFALITRQSQTCSTRHFLKRRWDRLLKPWLFWSVVYGVGRVTQAVCDRDLSCLANLLSLETLLAGTHIHLWYLPYAFASGLLLHVLNRPISKVNNNLVVFVATLVGVLTLSVCTLDTHVSVLRPPLPQWEFGLAALPVGLAVGRSLAMPSHRAQVRHLCMICVATTGTCAIATSFHAGSAPVPYGLAIVLVCLACGWQSNGNGFVAAVAPLTFGIYLVHPLAMYGVKHFFPADGHYAAFIALTTCLSGIVTWGLMRTPLRTVVGAHSNTA
jgi:surface polysaccharide O-acyltransferase-like enzyme